MFHGITAIFGGSLLLGFFRSKSRIDLLWSDRLHLRITHVGGGRFVFHIIDWHSLKQSRAQISIIEAEILSAAKSTCRDSLMAEHHQVLFDSHAKLPFILIVDSNGLYPTITTLHDGLES